MATFGRLALLNWNPNLEKKEIKAKPIIDMSLAELLLTASEKLKKMEEIS